MKLPGHTTPEAHMLTRLGDGTTTVKQQPWDLCSSQPGALCNCYLRPECWARYHPGPSPTFTRLARPGQCPPTTTAAHPTREWTAAT